MADEKARLRERMRELEAELGGLRRTVMGKPSPLPAVGTVLPGLVEGYGQAGCFATLETFGAGFIHMSEMSRRIVITQRRGAADETVGALLPAVEQASWPQHVVLANLTPEFVLPIGTKVWAEVIEPLYVGQLRLSLANVDQETGQPLPPEPPMPDLGAIIRGIVCHSESYGDLLLLPGYREAGAERNCRQALLHRSMQPKSQHGKLQVGQALWVRVAEIDAAAGRVGVSSKHITQHDEATGTYKFHPKTAEKQARKQAEKRAEKQAGKQAEKQAEKGQKRKPLGTLAQGRGDRFCNWCGDAGVALYKYGGGGVRCAPCVQRKCGYDPELTGDLGGDDDYGDYDGYGGYGSGSDYDDYYGY